MTPAFQDEYGKSWPDDEETQRFRAAVIAIRALMDFKKSPPVDPDLLLARKIVADSTPGPWAKQSIAGGLDTHPHLLCTLAGIKAGKAMR